MPNLKWRAHLDFYWECPECGLEILEGNPRKCPHQNGGRKAYYNPLRDGRVRNWQEVGEKCGLGEKEKVESPQPIPLGGFTTDQLVEQSCPHGT